MPYGFSAQIAEAGRREVAAALRALCQAVDADESSLLLPRNPGELAFYASTNPQLDGAGAPPVPVGSSFTGLAFRTGQTIAFADAARQPGHFKAVDTLVARATREFAAVPMVKSGGTVVGVLTLVNRKASAEAGQPFSPGELKQAEDAARDLAEGVALLAAMGGAGAGAGSGAPVDPALIDNIAALGEGARRVVRDLVASLLENGPYDHADG